AESSSFADELYAEQYAEQPERGHWEAGPQKKRQQYPNDAACQNPTPVRKRPYCQSKNQFRNALDQEENNQQDSDCKKTLSRMAEKEYPYNNRQDDRDKLKPEMWNVACAYETNTLYDTADNQHPTQQNNHCDRREHWIN